MSAPAGESAVPFRRSVFWPIAGILVGVQLLAVAVAGVFVARSVFDRAQDLAEEGLTLRLDSVADEVEQRLDWTNAGLLDPSAALSADLVARFPDPVRLVNADGDVLHVYARPGVPVAAASDMPADLPNMLLSGAITVRRPVGIAVAPLYDDVGFLAGGLVIHPIRASLARELAPARQALVAALLVAALVVLLVALAVAALVTWRLVRPLRAMTQRIAAIGDGDYASRVAAPRADEFGQLAQSINTMADQVASSIDRLQATDRIRRELVANVGHDLRTPLAATIGRIDEAHRLLSDGREEEAIRYLEGAAAQSAYLKRLVDDLFELSLLEVPDATLRREPVPVGELVRDAVAAHSHEAAARSIDLAADIETGLPLIDADGMRLLRLLNNLIVNAVAHVARGGHIRVRAAREGPHVTIAVADDGPGIDPARGEALFERYYRGTDARTRTERGTGLGLAIARAIARAHQGELTAANAPEGGAVFTVSLPVPTDA